MEKQQTERQTEIVNAAFSLVAERGVQELTIKKLGLAIGVSEPAIYRHFSSKREILEAMVERIEAMRANTWMHSEKIEQAPLARLRSFFTLQAQHLDEFPALSILLFPEEIFRNDMELLERIQSVMKATIHDIQFLVNKAQEQGELRKNSDPYTASLLITGGFRILVSDWRSNRQKTNGDSLLQKVQTFLDNTVLIFK